MDVIPAVDLESGECVRLLQGDRDRRTEYSKNPVEMAEQWQDKGANRLHVVDLDGAFDGDSENQPIIETIIDRLTIPVQVGGGLRSMRAVDELLAAGADRAIIGTAGVEDPPFLERLTDKFGADNIIAGVDTKGGQVMVEGWEQRSSVDRLEWVRNIEQLGIERVIYTDVTRDGMETGPDIEGTREITDKSSVQVIGSGGVGNLEHLEWFNQLESDQLEGVIVGKALYEGNFKFEQAQQTLDKG